MISNCQNIDQDLSKINEINSVLSNPMDLWLQISSNIITKGPEMVTRLMTAASDYNSGDYLGFGFTVSTSLFWFFDFQ